MPVVPLANLAVNVVALFVADDPLQAFRRFNELHSTTPVDRTTAVDFLAKYLDLVLQKAVVDHGLNTEFAR